MDVVMIAEPGRRYRIWAGIDPAQNAGRALTTTFSFEDEGELMIEFATRADAARFCRDLLDAVERAEPTELGGTGPIMAEGLFSEGDDH